MHSQKMAWTYLVMFFMNFMGTFIIHKTVDLQKPMRRQLGFLKILKVIGKLLVTAVTLPLGIVEAVIGVGLSVVSGIAYGVFGGDCNPNFEDCLLFDFFANSLGMIGEGIEFTTYAFNKKSNNDDDRRGRSLAQKVDTISVGSSQKPQVFNAAKDAFKVTNKPVVTEAGKKMIEDFKKNQEKLEKNGPSVQTGKPAEKSDELQKPLTPAALEQTRRRSFEKQLEDTDTTWGLLVKVQADGLVEKEKFAAYRTRQLDDQRIRIRDLVFQTVPEFFRRKRYERTDQYFYENYKDEFKPLLDKIRDPQSKPEEKEAAQKQTKALMDKYVISDEAMLEASYQKKQQEELLYEFSENGITLRDARSRVFGGLCRIVLVFIIKLEKKRLAKKNNALGKKGIERLEKTELFIKKNSDEKGATTPTKEEEKEGHVNWAKRFEESKKILKEILKEKSVTPTREKEDEIPVNTEKQINFY